ncbi:TPA: antitoxin [Streptococcus suis]|uniref:antitoxin n=1 Tax=Streptococcus suis TaxID=1307 RepID=UPI00155239B0|nr:antitoxin [Streptococcus suis]NQL63244.1 antitoxin [Streptococcus suis]HEM3187899.1 antitoxin [Streptococcus suis]HEM4102067.1 antitoxin [Streptococcus suis]
MSKQRYGRPSTGQKGNNRPTVVSSRENYDEVDNLSLGTGMSRSAIIDYFISEGLKRARIEEVIIKTKRLVLED